jgi:hypothetical protein
MSKRRIPNTRRGLRVVFDAQIMHMNMTNNPHNMPKDDDLWRMRVQEASLLLIGILDEGGPTNERKMPYDPMGWPELLMARIKERFENFDPEVHARFMEELEKEISK